MNGSRTNEWPDYLVERAMQPPPEQSNIVPRSTPVVAFGHPLDPEVATLGINPSSGEFLGRDKNLLAGPKRRLATLESLGVNSYEELDAVKAAEIIEDCATYFDRRPYAWFNPLNEILSGALNVSYFAKSACHLDLVQWATDPVWQGLSESVRSGILASDKAFLRTQVRHEGYRVIVVAGRTAMAWIAKSGLVQWRQVATLSKKPTASFFVGTSGTPLFTSGTPLFIGWSCNLQSQPGARRHISELTQLLKQHAAAALRR